MKMKNVINALICAVVFGIFAYVSCSVAVHSSDLENYEYKGQNRYYGYDRNRYLINHNRADEITLDEDDATVAEAPAGEAPAELTAEAAPAPALTPEPTPEATPDPNSPAMIAAAKGLPTPPDIDITEWQYMLVSAAYPLDPQDYAPAELAYLNMTGGDTDIVTTYDGNRQVVDIRIAQPLIDFAQGCKNAGLPVYLSSGYRSYDEQMYLYNRKVGQGYSEEVAKTIVAYPGTSEHQTGLVCDITDYYRETKDSSLENTETYQWLREHCTEYGFVVRYPADKSGSADSITGVIYEPWHFRYVGREAAEYIMANNLCLEEFWELYRPSLG